MMSGLLPKMLVILAFFLALCDPPAVSGLKCYTCGLGGGGGKQADVSGNGTATTPYPIGPVSVLSISKLNLQPRGASARATSDACNEVLGTDAKPAGDPLECDGVAPAGFKWACAKSKSSVGFFKTCGPVPTGAKMECQYQGDNVGCACDTDLCNGGSPLRNGFGMMSLALGAVYYVFC